MQGIISTSRGKKGKTRAQLSVREFEFTTGRGLREQSHSFFRLFFQRERKA